MISLIFIFLTWLLGLAVLNLSKNEFQNKERLFVGAVVGPTFFTIAAFVLSNLIGIRLATIFTIVLSLIIIAAGFKNSKKQLLKNKFNWFVFFNKEKKFLILLLFFLICFIWSQSRVILAPAENGLLGGRSNYGDMPYHTAVITSFAWADNFPPKNPIYAQLPLIYYFTADFFSAIMLNAGASLRESILIPTIFFSLVIVGLMSIITSLFKAKTAPFLAPFILLFNGGLGFLYFLKDNQGSSLFRSLTHITKEYNHMGNYNNNITNLISGLLVPERALLFAIPVFLTILLLLHKQKSNEKVNLLLLLAAVLSGLMPIVHLYGFVDLSLALCFYALIDLLSSGFSKKRLKKWLVFFLVFTLLSLPQLFFVWQRLQHSTFKIYFHFGWLKKPTENFFIFWFKNLGFSFPLVILSLLSFKIKTKIKLYFLPFIVIFILGNLFIFQPYDWDNIKLFLFILPAIAIIVSLLFEQLTKQPNFLKCLLFCALFFLTISGGLIGFIGEPQTRPLLFSDEDLRVADFIKNHTTPKSVFLTGPQHNSPASSLAGRQILMGYPGNIWVHGIDYSQREKDIFALFNPKSLNDFYNLARAYKIDFVLFGPGDNFLPSVDKVFFEKNLAKIFDNNAYQVYQISKD